MKSAERLWTAAVVIAAAALSVYAVDFKVSDSGAYIGSKASPRIAVDGTGNFMVSWIDKRYNSEGDLYAQRFNVLAVPQRTNFRVNQAQNYQTVYFPSNSLTFDRQGNILICWGQGNVVWVQRYNSSGTRTGSNIRINPDSAYYFDYLYSTGIGCDSSNNFNAFFAEERIDTSKIKVQRFFSSGTPNGAPVTVYTINSVVIKQVRFALDANANAIATWANGDVMSGGDSAVYALRISNTGTALGSAFKVNDAPTNNPYSYPSVACDSAGNFTIAWVDQREANYAVYAQRYDRNGTARGANFRVTDDIGGMLKAYPAAAMDETGNFMISWTDDRTSMTNRAIYAQRYDNIGIPIGANFKINGTNSSVDSMGSSEFFTISSDIKLKAGKIYATWNSAKTVYSLGRPTNISYNIWASVLDWNSPNPGSVASPRPGLSKSRLAQNLPNPFIGSTTIDYTIAEKGKVRLAVFNVAGRMIRRLVDRVQASGTYAAVWDGRDETGAVAPAGIYIYQLFNEGYMETKKMVLKR